MWKTFFIADTHFGHQHVIEYEHRPYRSVQEMDQDMITRWNKTVSDEDTVYFLGDFAFGSASYAATILAQLKGRKLLCRGNHDFRKSNDWWMSKGFSDTLTEGFSKEAAYLFERDGMKILLSHFPLDHPAYFNVHGHVHTHTEGINQRNHLCISVEHINYQPISWEALKQRILQIQQEE